MDLELTPAPRLETIGRREPITTHDGNILLPAWIRSQRSHGSDGGLGTERYLVAADAGRVALQPCEVAAGVDVQEVWPRRVADVHGHVVQAAKKTKRIIFSFVTETWSYTSKTSWC